MNDLKKYLIKAKEEGWTLDCWGLAKKYNLSFKQVRDLVNEVYNLKPIYKK